MKMARAFVSAWIAIPKSRINRVFPAGKAFAPIAEKT